MEIRYKGIEHERTEDSPFVGALVCAIECQFGCKGCCNEWLKDIEQPYYVKTAEEIVAEIKANPFNEGIILAGLEWSLQPQELVELVSVASKAGLQVMIYTGCGLVEFQTIIGKSCAEKYDMAEELLKYTFSEPDNGIFSFIGGMVLDTVIEKEYYIKCGRYDENDLAQDRVHFGVKLASNNQTIYKFLTDVEDKDNGQTEENSDRNESRKPNRAERRRKRK